MTQIKFIKQESGEFLRLRAAVSYDTYCDLENAFYDEFPEFIQPYMSASEFLLLIERLKNAEDDKNIFLKGKWATIQALQDYFEKTHYKRL